MNTSKTAKAIMFALVYGINLFFALLLWLTGFSENILLGIILILFYRLSLWLSPIAATIICWLPLKTGVPAYKKLLFNLVHLVFCAALFLLCYLLFGSWY